MVELRWPEGRGRFVDRHEGRVEEPPRVIDPGSTFETDDEGVVDHYTDRGFELVGGDGSDNDDVDGFDVEAFVERTPVSDVVDDIKAGEADGYLDAVAEEDDRVTVQQAVEERQDEIGSN